MDSESDALLPSTLGGVPEWLTVTEAAAYLRVHRTTIYAYCDRGLLPFYELRGGGGRRFRPEDLDALLEPGNPKSEGGTHGKQAPR